MPTYLESRELPRAWIATAMTLGQWPEIGTLAVLPWLVRRLDFKWTLALGIGAWVARYGSLALDPRLRKGAVSFGTAQITNDRESWGSRVDGMLDGRDPRTD